MTDTTKQSLESLNASDKAVSSVFPEASEKPNATLDIAQESPAEFHARLGEPLPAGLPIATESMVIEALKTVQDPELALDIYSLGLIYKIDIAKNGDVAIEMTLTSPMCPIAGEMPAMVAQAVARVEGVGVVDVSLVWDPPWTLDMLDDDLKIALGIDIPLSDE